ncbi:MAG: hypothetical protein AMJ73_02265 [candidate division Zixibacteria bacterium SM1_73]|nr:MAG: hypothetical protein AMJ73_02265 [candidate division Zixibacteria bacterium SM1_73]
MGEGGGEIEMTSPSPQPLPSFDTESSFNIESQNEMQNRASRKGKFYQASSLDRFTSAAKGGISARQDRRALEPSPLMGEVVSKTVLALGGPAGQAGIRLRRR